MQKAMGDSTGLEIHEQLAKHGEIFASPPERRKIPARSWWAGKRGLRTVRSRLYRCRSQWLDAHFQRSVESGFPIYEDNSTSAAAAYLKALAQLDNLYNIMYIPDPRAEHFN